jgi:hypothetical protein
VKIMISSPFLCCLPLYLSVDVNMNIQFVSSIMYSYSQSQQRLKKMYSNLPRVKFLLKSALT